MPTDLKCPGDQIVWVNTHSRIFRHADGKWFGRTKFGKYTCERGALAEGDRETLSGD